MIHNDNEDSFSLNKLTFLGRIKLNGLNQSNAENTQS